MARPDDATYYAQLQAGALFLAGNAEDPDERAAHHRMADVYRGRSDDAGAGPKAAGLPS